MFICDIILLLCLALLVGFISLFFIDCDISLAIKLKFGKKIGQNIKIREFSNTKFLKYKLYFVYIC